MSNDDFVPACDTKPKQKRGKYDMVQVSEIEHFRGKAKFEVFVAHCLWRLRLIGRHNTIVAEKQLNATLETNRLLKKLAGETETPIKDESVVAKVKRIGGDLLDDGKYNKSNVKKTSKKDKK